MYTGNILEELQVHKELQHDFFFLYSQINLSNVIYKYISIGEIQSINDNKKKETTFSFSNQVCAVKNFPIKGLMVVMVTWEQSATLLNYFKKTNMII